MNDLHCNYFSNLHRNALFGYLGGMRRCWLLILLDFLFVYFVLLGTWTTTLRRRRMRFIVRSRYLSHDGI